MSRQIIDESLVKEGRKHAERLLIANGGELGLLGSNQAYQQVWARDSMISGFGLLLCDSDEGKAIHKRSLETLRKFQSNLGKIPHNVGYTNVNDPALIAHGGKLKVTGKEGVPIEDTIHAGCIDSNLWYIIGHYYNYMVTKDKEFLQNAWPSLEKALLWLRYQDSNECGLLEVHEAMDWADLFGNRYNVLFDNVLYYAVWTCMAHLANELGYNSDFYMNHAKDVHKKINVLLWVGPEEPKDYEWIANERKEWLYPLKRVETELVERPFYLPYMGFRDFADRFDTLANLLAIIFGVADKNKANKILDYIHDCGLNEPFPVQALYPVIRPGEKDWREYYRVRNLNQPHHYHNGGAWPFIGGFYVAALVKVGRMEEAERQLVKLAEMNRMGKKHEWEFNEWFHGLSGRPMGYGVQSWSAAMYLYAENAVNRGELNIFNSQNGWDCN
ncbi:glycogen debranching protein [Parageobacillus sp. VR-IP]|uniref:amylo-alpha-1,6-glucosidase n=1 Tax=Parageobacillus sp. VR-IP TaxID=2742205 RepID=UPI001582F820|nr:glycoside hydrolase 100 family protein [Parageobacillus sp. VR-IP]NUK30261.1 glycogen debranching protein [Parageobacillus sp. VR-IP]